MIVTTATTELSERIDNAHERFDRLLMGVPDHQPVCSGWTSSDVVGHRGVSGSIAGSPKTLRPVPRAAASAQPSPIECQNV